jgi:glycerol-3-phosphate acyltransferase PlsY
MTTLIAITIVAYLLGGLPTAYVVGWRLRGLNVRALGSGNVGAANTAETLGFRIGVGVLVVDVAKGAIAVGIAVALGVSTWGVIVVALAVIAGHNFSPYLRLRGGRGVATALGVSTVLVPVIALVGFAIGAVWLVRTRQAVDAGVAAFVATNVLVIALGAPVAVLSMCALVSLLVLGTHVAREGTWRRPWALRTSKRAIEGVEG